ncbi:ParA family protein [Mycobacteroides abscessus subsp. abscessus]|uniref:ParA family protein n=1 Tax=Mycobacteroides abscessus TaxID=36809 RepID=UPI0004731670|nr:ParA family protein [Mycobacteroides abscessus]MDO3101045.1 ParA family protein [Mycobacteroides abscessus subsp. abscessus]MDO3185008.1 ParA family protein [Mycobacteroides abscessus subsp. abscessus]MDO3194369.1 ParA family protein [Mycobacteroides abscessus subsp. abscessus]MDO3287436.1 ParA family protein [Mycobacteroides abscessus subsp. abscessus]OLT84730.1 chromosome partitioning protein ParA [Mycobacteroides abscessus subsp. abscessus]
MNSVMTMEAKVPTIEWSRLGHVYVVANGKGGVGKTTTAAHMAGLMAMDGARTLIVDLNGQGNISTLLGIANKEVDDGGRNLFSAITAGAPLTPARDVRPNLDVVMGGPYIRKINPVLSGEMTSKESADRAYLGLADALQRISHHYRLIIIDSPPENQMLLQLALSAARFVIIPMAPSAFSRVGLREVATEIRGARERNPLLTLLAVFVFASISGATSLRKNFLKTVEEDLGGRTDVLLTEFIRHAETVGEQMAKFGLLAYELENEIKNNPKQVAKTNKGVAEDYDKLTRKILRTARARQAEMIELGVWK